jgi:hypothetical protein
MSASYRIVTTRFRGISPSGKAVFVDKPIAGETSIPRSLIHGGDDRKFEGSFVGEEITFRLMEWKAEEIGFA